MYRRRQRTGQLWELRGNQFADGALVRVVDIGMDEADRDCGCPLGREYGHCRSRGGKVELGQNRAVGADAPGYFAAQLARHQRRGQVDAKVVNVVARFGRHFDDVAKAFGHQ